MLNINNIEIATNWWVNAIEYVNPNQKKVFASSLNRGLAKEMQKHGIVIIINDKEISNQLQEASSQAGIDKSLLPNAIMIASETGVEVKHEDQSFIPVQKNLENYPQVKKLVARHY